MDSSLGSESYFGSTKSLHTSIMSFLWGPAINVTIFLIYYTYRKIWWWIHALLALAITYITLVSSIPIFVKTGLI